MASNLIILVAEDDPNDVLLLKRAFAKNGITMPVHVSEDGEDAMKYLKGEGEYGDRERFPFPRVIITDLKMPKCGGFDILRWLYEHPECNLIPKMVLSSSQEPQDVKLAYRLGANGYLVKPGSFDDLCLLVEKMNHFWASCALPELPTKC